MFLIFVDVISFTILPPKQSGMSQSAVTGGHALCLKYQLSHYDGSSSDTFEHLALFYDCVLSISQYSPHCSAFLCLECALKLQQAKKKSTRDGSQTGRADVRIT